MVFFCEFIMVFFVDLCLKYFDFFMFFEDLRIKCLMFGCFMHPISQFLNLLLLLRQLNAGCADGCWELTILKLSCCLKVVLLAIELSCIKDSFTYEPLSDLVVFNPFHNFISINCESCRFQDLDVIFAHNYKFNNKWNITIEKIALVSIYNF